MDDPDNQIQIIAREKDLVIKQLWDGRQIIVLPLTNVFFFNQDQSYPVRIIRDSVGAVKQVVVLNREVFIKRGSS